MLYAKVVFSLAVSGPFDYIVPEFMQKKIKTGSRVRVYFGTRQMNGYCIGLSRKTNIKKLKSVIELIDEYPVLSKNLVYLTRKISDYYSCSLGEAIDTALPSQLRKGKIKVSPVEYLSDSFCREKHITPLVIQDINTERRWNRYFEEIKISLENKKSSVVLLPDIYTMLKFKDKIERFLGCEVNLLYRKQPGELKAWLKIRSLPVTVVLGTRSAVFAPVNNLGLVIVEREEDPVYKQDQVPHYHAREVAMFRSEFEHAKLVLGSPAVSLETFHYAKERKFTFISVPINNDFPEIKIIDPKFNSSNAGKKVHAGLQYLSDLLLSNMTAGGKTLLFINRRGFATLASCINCGFTLKCPRCNINLVYHYKDKVLECHYCNHKIVAPKICPICNSGYIKYSGEGAEKIESDLQRILPQARIAVLDSSVNERIPEADIYIATKSVIKSVECKFQLTVVLGLNNMLSRIDFRSAEKANSLLFSLVGLTEKKMILETSFARHHVFEALKNLNRDIFYTKEIEERKALGFPPFKHFCLVKLRGKFEDRVKKVSEALFEFLRIRNKNKLIQVMSVNPGVMQKLRGNYYWGILIRANAPQVATKFLRINLRNFPHSGIIVTVDMDPI